MKSEIKIFDYPNGDRQRVQIVQLDSFSQLDFYKPSFTPKAFDQLCDLYDMFFAKKLGFLFGKLVLFYAEEPDCTAIKREDTSEQLKNPQMAVLKQFKKNITCRHHQLVFKDEQTKQLFEMLKRKGQLRISEGKLDKVQFMCVDRRMGFLSQIENEPALLVNSHFFIMNVTDIDSDYDLVGTPFGLAVKDGKMIQPPLFDREVFMVNENGQTSVRPIGLNECSVEIDGIVYRHRQNARFYSRPHHRKTPKGRYDLIIVNDRIVSIRPNGASRVPCCGFVLSLDHPLEQAGNTQVVYHGFENLQFAIQVGNSAIVNHKMTERFISPFHHMLNRFVPTFPPANYPLNYKKDRAPRMVLASDSQEHPVLLWLEGAGKFGYQKGIDSCGASLSETAKICRQLNLKNAVHLDGGGSAQILLKKERLLKISDRDDQTFAEKERAVPMALIARK